jgi:hypothetical protein
MKTLPLLAVLLLPAPALAANDVYRALVDGRSGALFSIQFGPETLGSVTYDRGGDGELLFSGKTRPDGSFRWEERQSNRLGQSARTTGHYSGRLAADRTRGEGVWTRAGGGRALPFTLARIARGRELKAPDGDVSASWPEFEEARYAPLNRHLAETAQQDLARQVAAFKQNREELKAIGSASADRLSLATDCSVQSVAENLVSLFCSEYEYLGGAHGNTEVVPRNFAIGPDGAVQPVGLWDLLSRSPQAERELSRLLLADLRRQGASAVKRGEIKSFVEGLAADGIPFTVRPAGLVFHFPPYAVGAYAEGAFEVRVPNPALAPFIRGDGALAGRRPPAVQAP